MKTFSIQTLHNLGACELENRLDDLYSAVDGDISDDEQIPVTTWFGLKTTSVSDALWVAGHILHACDEAIEIADRAVARARAVPSELPATQTAVDNAIRYAMFARTEPEAEDIVYYAGRAVYWARRALFYAHIDYPDRGSTVKAHAAYHAENTAQWQDVYSLLGLGEAP